VGHLPTLKGILKKLGAYTSDPKATIAQIGQEISRDPSLSVRLLRMANSAYYARPEPVVDIDEAVLFLGVEQLRMLSMTTHCVEVLSPQDRSGFVWEDFWRHCIATAQFSCSLGKRFKRAKNNPELDYMSGLLHDVGKLVIAMLSPEGFGFVISKARAENLSFHQAERLYFDTDHGALGGWYLERQNVPPAVYEAVRCHHNWKLAVKDQEIGAIVNVADFLARLHQVGCSGNMEPVQGFFTETPAWNFLVENFELKEDVLVVTNQIQEEAQKIGTLVDSLMPRKRADPATGNGAASLGDPS